MGVELLRQRVAEGSDNGFPGFGVVIDVVFSTEHALGLCHADAEGDPFAGWSALQ